MGGGSDTMTTISHLQDDETFVTLIPALWRARLFLFLGALAGVIVATAMALTAVPFYRAEMIIAPVQSSPVPGQELSVTGRSPLSQANHSRFEQFIEILDGPEVLRAAIESQPDLLSKISARQRFVFWPALEVQSPEDAATLLESALTIRPSGQTELRIIRFEHPDPVFAREFIASLHMIADRQLRNAAAAQSEARLNYLTETLRTEQNSDHRDALGLLLLQQQRELMSIRMDHAFAAVVLEPAFTLPRPVWPRALTLYTLLLLIGIVLGWITFGLVTYDRPPRER